MLTDASAVRALAHPARLVVIDALYGGEVLTATECAALAGISASAMSYHLRALEKYGLVRRAEPRGDGRERPWMKAGENLAVRIQGSRDAAASMSAAELLVSNSIELDRERLLASMRVDASEGRSGAWRDTTHYSRSRLVLTADEARSLAAGLEALLEPYLAERRSPRPEGATAFNVSLALTRDVPR